MRGLSRLVCQGESDTSRARVSRDELEKHCPKVGVEISVGDDQRVYCLNVKVDTALPGMPVAVLPTPAYRS
jgi:hypothetical protein